MLVSVITPARNAAKTIERCIISVLRQNFEGNLEYIVVEGGSTDGTRQILEKYQTEGKIKLIIGPGKGPATARNIGIKEARGEILVFIDADCEADENWMRNLIKPFKKEEVGGVCGSVKTPRGLSLIGRIVGLDWEYRQEERIVKGLRWFHFMNTAYRREIFDKIGLLNEEFVTGEDQEFFRRAVRTGYKFLFVEDAVVYHYHRSTLLGFLKQFFNYGRGSIKALRKEKSLEVFILYLYFLLLICSSALIPLGHAFSYTPIILFILGFGKYFINSLQVYHKSRDPCSLFIGPLTYLGRFAKFLGFIFSLLGNKG